MSKGIAEGRQAVTVISANTPRDLVYASPCWRCNPWGGKMNKGIAGGGAMTAKEKREPMDWVTEYQLDYPHEGHTEHTIQAMHEYAAHVNKELLAELADLREKLSEPQDISGIVGQLKAELAGARAECDLEERNKIDFIQQLEASERQIADRPLTTVAISEIVDELSKTKSQLATTILERDVAEETVLKQRAVINAVANREQFYAALKGEAV